MADLRKAAIFRTVSRYVEKIPYTSTVRPGFDGGNRGGTSFFEKSGVLRLFFRKFQKKKKGGTE